MTIENQSGPAAGARKPTSGRSVPPNKRMQLAGASVSRKRRIVRELRGRRS